MKQYINELITIARQVSEDPTFPKIFDAAVETIANAFEKGNSLFVAGNGGSAADSQHFAAEFMGKYKIKRKPYPAIALTTDTSMLTAWSNDENFETVFSRQIEGLGKKGDVFVGISTSGNSPNILSALQVAKRLGILTITFLGNGGGKMKGMADVEIIVPSNNTPRIQEIHTLVLHSIAEEVERRLHEKQ